MVGRVHKAVHLVHDFGHFHNMIISSYLLTMPIIKDSAKPITRSEFDKTSSSFINICISNYKVSTMHFHIFHRLT